MFKTLFVGVLFLGLGTPINKLPEFLIFITAFVLVVFGALHPERWRRLAAVAAILAALGLAGALKPPAIGESFNVFLFKEKPGALPEGLPSDVFQVMSEEMRALAALYRCNEKQAGCWLYKLSPPELPGAFSADGALDAGPGHSRRVHDIGFDRRDQVFSAAINRSRYHIYGTEKNLDRQFLPVFVKHRFPTVYEGSRLCWTGTLIRPSPHGGYDRLTALDHEQCVDLNGLAERPDTIVYSFDPARKFSMRLDRPWMVAVQDIGGRLMRVAAVIAAVLLLVDFRQRRRLLIPVVAFSGTLVWIMGWTFRSKAMALLDGLRIYPGGTDGLSYDSLARGILFNAVSGNWTEALRGGESVFYFQPGFRYVLALGKFLFGRNSLLLHPHHRPCSHRRLQAPVPSLPSTLGDGAVPGFPADPHFRENGLFESQRHCRDVPRQCGAAWTRGVFDSDGSVAAPGSSRIEKSCRNIAGARPPRRESAGPCRCHASQFCPWRSRDCRRRMPHALASAGLPLDPASDRGRRHRLSGAAAQHRVRAAVRPVFERLHKSLQPADDATSLWGGHSEHCSASPSIHRHGYEW